MPSDGTALPFKLTKSILSKKPFLLNIEGRGRQEPMEHLSDRFACLAGKKKKSQSDIDNVTAFRYI
ncbi:hypothetical protein B5F25_01220 [Bacteroides sp. An19]|nr:hypothetical protein B5F25_01220 [Bacteroides sp. An19]